LKVGLDPHMKKNCSKIFSGNAPQAGNSTGHNGKAGITDT